MKNKRVSKVLEEAIIDTIESYKATHKKCEACGEICLTADMECVNIDEEKAQALVCPKCYFGAEERADEHLDPDHDPYFEYDIQVDKELSMPSIK